MGLSTTFALSLKSRLPCRENIVNAFGAGASTFSNLASSTFITLLPILDPICSNISLTKTAADYEVIQQDVCAAIFPNYYRAYVTASVNVPINYQIINVYDISNKSVETEPSTRYQFIELQPIDTAARAFVYDPYSAAAFRETDESCLLTSNKYV